MLCDWKIQRKMSILTKLTYIFNAIPIKILAEFCRCRKLTVRLIQKNKRTRITKTALNKKNEVGGF